MVFRVFVDMDVVNVLGKVSTSTRVDTFYFIQVQSHHSQTPSVINCHTFHDSFIFMSIFSYKKKYRKRRQYTVHVVFMLCCAPCCCQWEL